MKPPKYTPPTLEQLADPSYQMSMPSHNPLDELGYTAQHQEILRNPLARLTYDPSMHFYPEAGVPQAWGAVNTLKPKSKIKYKWGNTTKKSGKRNKAMYKAITDAFPKGPDRDRALNDAVFLDQALRGEGIIFSPQYEKWRGPEYADMQRRMSREQGEKAGTPMHEEMHKGLIELKRMGLLDERPYAKDDGGQWDHDIIDMYFYKYGTEYQKKEARMSLMSTYDNIAVVEKVLGKRLETVLKLASDLFENKETFEKVLKTGDTRTKASGKKKRF